MSEPENFLERWSRRKREAGDAPLPSTATSKEEENARDESSEKGPSSDASPCEPAPFDVSTLPSIESIGADSDVRAFMQPGVPLDLRHAALRRAWSADPEIRDFIGLVENGWNFNDPNGVPGFGPLPEGVDIKSLLSQAIGTPQPDTAQPAVAPEELPDQQISPVKIAKRQLKRPPRRYQPPIPRWNNLLARQAKRFCSATKIILRRKTILMNPIPGDGEDTAGLCLSSANS